MKTSLPDTINTAKMSVTGKLFYLAAIGSIAFLAAGCASINYRPAVSLGISPNTIKANVKLETFVDASPQSDKSHVFAGLSTCEPGTLEGELASDVTDAILTDFNNNQVFQNLKKRYDTQPDLIMKGTIHRFSGKFGTTPVFWLTIPIDTIWLFGLPIMSDDIVVDLEVSIQRPDGSVVGTYHGQSSNSQWYNMYQNVQFALPTRTNKAFSESVSQIRDQIMKDADKLTPKTQ
ncbi:MAG: hypothetical protein WAO21_06785 [Verrucomicrobiia bacterium]